MERFNQCCGLNKNNTRCKYNTKSLLVRDLNRYNHYYEQGACYYVYCKKHNKLENDLNNSNSYQFGGMIYYETKYYSIFINDYESSIYCTKYDGKFIDSFNEYFSDSFEYYYSKIRLYKSLINNELENYFRYGKDKYKLINNIDKLKYLSFVPKSKNILYHYYCYISFILREIDIEKNNSYLTNFIKYNAKLYNKEDLIKEAFKPSRLLNRINIYGEDYEFI